MRNACWLIGLSLGLLVVGCGGDETSESPPSPSNAGGSAGAAGKGGASGTAGAGGQSGTSGAGGSAGAAGSGGSAGQGGSGGGGQAGSAGKGGEAGTSGGEAGAAGTSAGAAGTTAGAAGEAGAGGSAGQGGSGGAAGGGAGGAGQAGAAGGGGGGDPGLLSEGEAYPQGLFLAGNSVYWANNQPAGCVRTTTKSGGAVSDTGCEPTGQTQPLQATLFNGKIVWAYMNTSQQPNNLGYGGVRSADVGGANAKEIESSARFVSTSGAAFCNDVFASSDNRLFWYSHLTPNGPFKEGAIRRYDGSKVVSFGDASAFPGGLAATPTTLFFGANNFLKKLAVNAAEGTKATDLLETNGRGCGTVVVGETLYTATLGGLTQDKPPTLYTGTASSVSAAGVLPEIAYYLASDGTDLYMAFDKKIARVPLSSPGSAPQTVLDSSVSIGGLAVDATHLYWTEYTASGAVRRKAK